MVMAGLPWLILWLPLAAGLTILLVGLHRPRLSQCLAVAGLAIGFLATLVLFTHALQHPHAPPAEQAFPWVILDGLRIEFGVLVDPLAILMLLVVTGVGLAIFLYSIGYMAEDPSVCRYFALLSLFAFSMLGLVLANNFIMLFMFWELVGMSSYLLIGFWYEKPSAADAGKKAFLVNRVADFGFLIGILLLWTASGATGQERTFGFTELALRIPTLAVAGGAIPSLGLGVAGVLIFCGVVGKSAQFPLHVWLPDAMEGPTPVSALIHAATMVAGGVYLLCRCFFLYAELPQVLMGIAYLGGFTAIFAASIALVQDDIKRILAYSTLSQLGYMVMALGLGGYTAGMYHLTTHAFFKALLFLGAGCIIHARHTNNIWEMGGLARSMPTTTTTFLIGTFALCGLWPLSGFWSKDEILTLAYDHDRLLWLIGSVTAALTACYMGRLCCAALLGPPRVPHGSPAPATHHAVPTGRQEEAPPVMTIPLILLATLSVIGGFLGIPAFVHHHRAAHAAFNGTVALVSTLCAVAGLGAAWWLYGTPNDRPARLQRRWRGMYNLLTRGYYMNEAYGWLVRNSQDRLAWGCQLIERYVIIRGCVNGVAVATRSAGSFLRLMQTGLVHTYALAFLAGLLALLTLATTP